MLPDEPGALLTRSSRGLQVASVLWDGRAVPVLSGIICPGIDWLWCGLMVLLTTSKMIRWRLVRPELQRRVKHPDKQIIMSSSDDGWLEVGHRSDIAMYCITSDKFITPPDGEARICLLPRVWSGGWQCGGIPSKWVLALLILTNLILCPAPAPPRPCKQS